MITNSRDKDLIPTKQEATNGAAGDNHKPPAVTSSRLWPGLRDPRIVRVSRAFGGKDRHSKVSTVRGLRDRRVRLSVPTAIQLYDLQDRLGVNQPSKVVDWLLSAAHREIDKLPPLQIPQSLSQCHEAAALSRNPSRPPVAENFEHANEHWEAAANAYLSQFGTRPSQAEAPPALAVPDSQMLLCPQGPSSSSMFPSYFFGSAEFDAKQYFVQTQIANWAQSNSAKSSPHFGGTPVRPFP